MEQHLKNRIELVINNIYTNVFNCTRFSECAADKDFNELRKDKFQKQFGTLVADIEQKKPLGLANQKQNYWNTLNSLTHTGTAQLSRKIQGENITNSHDPEFIDQILKFSSNYALLACGKLARISGSKNAQESFLSIAKDWHDL